MADSMGNRSADSFNLYIPLYHTNPKYDRRYHESPSGYGSYESTTFDDLMFVKNHSQPYYSTDVCVKS